VRASENVIVGLAVADFSDRCPQIGGGVSIFTALSTMTFQSLRSLSLRVPMAAVAGAMALLSGGAAQAGDDIFEVRPGSFYAASSLGFIDARSYSCTGSSSCSRDQIGGKVFGGWRFTPNLAAEVSYYYLGAYQATKDAVQPANVISSRTLKNKAVSVGIDWSGELLGVLTQHIRFGLARVITTGTESFGNGTTLSVNENNLKPFVGLGMSYQINEHVRIYQSFDYMRNRDNNHFHMYSMGLGIEN
jgi:outer membrane protein W